jgi:hypothetical protein
VRLAERNDELERALDQATHRMRELETAAAEACRLLVLIVEEGRPDPTSSTIWRASKALAGLRSAYLAYTRLRTLAY